MNTVENLPPPPPIPPPQSFVPDNTLHTLVNENKKGKLKSVLNKGGIIVDVLDLNNCTALYYACLTGNKDCVKILLNHNASPNERCQFERTPIHAAAINGSIKIMSYLIQYGGNLRLVDKDGKSAKDFAMRICDSEKKKSLLKFIDDTLFMINSPASKSQQTSLCPINFSNCLPTTSDHNINNYTAFPFEKIHINKKVNEITETIASTTTQIEEHELIHDPLGLTCNNGAFMVYEGMKWKEKLLVTVKRLHSKPISGACSDFLIQEQNILSKISFPKIIQLIGVTKSSSNDRQSLVFERVQYGSLYNILHENNGDNGIRIRNLVEIISSVCDAIIYLHEQKIIHCYINSHSVLMVTAHTPKLANLEYAVNKTTDLTQQKRSRVTDNKYLNCAWNWLAPELMINEIPHEKSDMYSFCAFVWELFNLEIPWKDMEWHAIKTKLHDDENSLPVDLNLIPFPFNRILRDGLSYNSIKRMSFEEVKTNLDNFRESVRLKSQLKTTKKNVYTNVVNNTKKSSKTGMFINDYAGSDTATTGTAAATATTDDFEKASQFSTKSFICCDAYQAEFHVSKDGFSVVSKETRNKDRSFSRNRQHNQSHDKSTRRNNNNNKANLSESGQHNKVDTPKSNEFNLDSNNNNINTNNNNNAQTSKQSGYPPTPPPLPHTGLYVNAPSYIPINYNSNKLPIPPPPPPPPNLVQPSSSFSLATTKTTKSTSKSKKKSDLMSNTPTLEELSSHSSRNAQHFINQSKFTSITTDDNQSNDIPVGYLTPSNTPKHCDFNRKVTSSSINRQHSATSNQIIEELKTRANSSSRINSNVDQLSLNMNQNLSKQQQQQPILSQNTKMKNQLTDVLSRQYKHVEDQEKLQNDKKNFDYDYQTTGGGYSGSAPSSSTPINVTRNRLIFERHQTNEFDRLNPNRFSNNSYSAIPENIQQPTPDDKVRYFLNKNSEEIDLQFKVNSAACRKLEISTLSDENQDDNQISKQENGITVSRNSSLNNNDASMKKIYSNVRKSTILAKSNNENNIETELNNNNNSKLSVAQLVSEHISNCNSNSKNKPPTSQSMIGVANTNTISGSGNVNVGGSSSIQNQEFNLKKPKQKTLNHTNLAKSGSFNRISDTTDTNSIKHNFLGHKSTSKDTFIDAKKFYQFVSKLQNVEQEQKDTDQQQQQHHHISRKSSSFSESHSQRSSSLGNSSNINSQQYANRFGCGSKIGSEPNNENNLNQQFNLTGSVKSLVKNYEENHKNEQTTSDLKTKELREARFREINDAVESSKQALNAAAALVAAQQQQQIDNLFDTINDNNNNNNNNNNNDNVLPKLPDIPKQFILQKELSTISERTENSANNKAAAVIATPASTTSSSQSSTAGQSTTSMLNTYPNSNKSTSGTKSIRNLNNLNLDTTVGGVGVDTGGGGSNKLNNQSNSSVVFMSTPKTYGLGSNSKNEFFPNNQSETRKHQVNFKTSNTAQTFTNQSSINNSFRSATFTAEELIAFYQEKKKRLPRDSDNNNNNLNDIYTSRFTKQNDSATRNSIIQDKIDRSNINKNRKLSNKSNYSSQEDFLSSMNGDLSIECSESVFLTLFDNKQEKASVTYLGDNETDEFNQLPSIPTIFMQPTTDNNYNYNNSVANSPLPPPPPPPPPPPQAQPSLSKYKTESNLARNSFTNRPHKSKDNSKINSTDTSYSIAAVSALSLSSTCSSSSSSSNSKNVRLEKHYIDTSKYKGYQYKLETRSNVTNQYHIESSLTNVDTGHSLLLAKTRVQTPKISTKIIIDR